MLEPISKTRVSQTAVESIKSYIAKQELKPGEKLPSEREMSDALHISRTSVREALRILEIIGLIEVRPGSGIFFKDWSGDLSIPFKTWLPKNESTLYEIYEVRLLIEPNAASLAAERTSPECLEQMQICMEKFRQSVEENDLPGMILADTEFHTMLANATQNKTLAFLMNTITRYMPEAWKASLRVPQRPHKTILEHTEIFNAISNHDPTLANQAMVIHLENALLEIQEIRSKNEQLIEGDN